MFVLLLSLSLLWCIAVTVSKVYSGPSVGRYLQGRPGCGCDDQFARGSRLHAWGDGNRSCLEVKHYCLNIYTVFTVFLNAFSCPLSHFFFPFRLSILFLFLCFLLFWCCAFSFCYALSHVIVLFLLITKKKLFNSAVFICM